MTYKDLGFHLELENFRKETNLSEFEIGRIILEHKEKYIVKTPAHEFEAELIGNLRYTARNRYDFPAVGDWVAFSVYDQAKALIHAVYPRNSILERKAVGKIGQVQIIATNIDYGLIVQAVDRDFNLNRLERYLTICNASEIEPIIVLSKVDLISEQDLDSIIEKIKQRIKNLPIISVSNQTKGYTHLQEILEQGKTYCLLGSSGVGKSTLLNSLSGKELMETSHISTSVNKGRHTTSHRELFVLESGGILIDNPGMREVGITDTSEGLELTFDAMKEYAKNCRFKDCTHTLEKGCALLEAVENQEIDAQAYNNYLKIQKEQQFFASDVKERRKKDKDFGKMIKNVKNFKNKNR